MSSKGFAARAQSAGDRWANSNSTATNPSDMSKASDNRGYIEKSSFISAINLSLNWLYLKVFPIRLYV
jgi:hypothetical protein